MAPNLSIAQHVLSHDMILSEPFSDKEKAAVVACSERTIRRHRRNYKCYQSTRAPLPRKGRPSIITPTMETALFERLVEKPDEPDDDLELFLWDEFRRSVPGRTIRRRVRVKDWTPKVMRCVAQQRNPDLRAYFDYHVIYPSYYRVYVDESGSDKRIGFRRRGWAPRGITPSRPHDSNVVTGIISYQHMTRMVS